MTRIHEHALATRRNDSLSFILVHGDREGHQFNFENVGRTKHPMKCLEAWHSSKRSVNKHIDLNHICLPMRSKDRSIQINGTGSWIRTRTHQPQSIMSNPTAQRLCPTSSCFFHVPFLFGFSSRCPFTIWEILRFYGETNCKLERN